MICIGCNNDYPEDFLTNISFDKTPFKVCPQCAFIVGYYQEVLKKPKNFVKKGDLSLDRIAAPIKKIILQEYQKDPMAAVKKYLGDAIDSIMDDYRKGIIHLDTAEYNAIKSGRQRMIHLRMKYLAFRPRKGKSLTLCCKQESFKRQIRMARTIETTYTQWRQKEYKEICCLLEGV